MQKKEEITGEDLDKILVAIGDLFKYLNNKYGDDEKFDEEVFAMTRTLYDPAVEEKGRMKGLQEGKLEVAKKMILLEIDIKKIVIATELTEEEINKLSNMCSEDEREKYNIE